ATADLAQRAAAGQAAAKCQRKAVGVEGSSAGAKSGASNGDHVQTEACAGLKRSTVESEVVAGVTEGAGVQDSGRTTVVNERGTGVCVVARKDDRAAVGDG